ncbi:RNHCP domain-containing protein [Kribbella sp. NBC_01505]|uniref:RNHCP domain-containing protein n=1 Tax=Kribbella sp. NBC_01505 TaxID=2903580 RepID=UPI00386DC950
MSRSTENTGFTCAYCAAPVTPLTNGSYRNHCPQCLYSLHVDLVPGDRANSCRALMRPVMVEHHPAKGYMLVHECLTCGARHRNRVAQDSRQPDDLDQLLTLLPEPIRKNRSTHGR